jgi:3-hydroxyacyl-[acyl-carrier-protein] dehydratase
VGDFGEIRSSLPHGPQMVLLDRVEWLDPGRRLRATKAITGSELCYQHLAPGLPAERYAYPASLIMESFGQAALMLWVSRPGFPGLETTMPMLAAVRDFVIEGQAFPGDVLRHEVEFERSIADTGFASGQTWAGDRRIVAVGSIVAVTRPAPAPPVAQDRLTNRQTVDGISGQMERSSVYSSRSAAEGSQHDGSD